MLTEEQKKRIIKSFGDDEEIRRIAMKKIIDDAGQIIYEIIFILECADEFPDVQSKIPPELIQSLNDAYFMAFKVDTKFSDPKEVMDLLAANCVLHRKCADLREEIIDLVHRVEYYKYMTNHMDKMLNDLKGEN